MAYAAYRELLGSLLAHEHLPARHARRPGGVTWMVLDITVHGGDAFRVRHALGTCADCAVLRCVPLLEHLGDHRVRLEVRLASHGIDEVIHRVLQCVPDGEIGHLMSWSCHLKRCDGRARVDAATTANGAVRSHGF